MQTIKSTNCFYLSDELKNTVGKLIKTASNIVIACHKNPDGDALGSALGLALALERMEKSVQVVLPDHAPDFLHWLPGYSRISVYEKQQEKVNGILNNADLLVAVDLSQADRLGELADPWMKATVPSVLIDHHPGTGDFTQHAVIQDRCGSTSEIIYYLLESMELTEFLDQDSATCLLTGIITDTLGFRVASSYPAVFGVVMELMRLGANKDQVFNEVYNQGHEGRLRLLGFSLAERLRVYPEKEAACIYLSRKDMNQFEFRKGDTEGFVNYPLTIKEIKISVLFTELSDHIKLSLRSKGDVDVNLFAREFFEGGGHKNAAGGQFVGSLEDAVQYFEEIISKQKE